ncbi:hypothetical protein [Marinicella sp. W31]|uniref:hypothetical protein n=1 Tax=Marinicella sp. W31 TaxID=3023713 RepID=UPI003757ED9B
MKFNKQSKPIPQLLKTFIFCVCLSTLSLLQAGDTTNWVSDNNGSWFDDNNWVEGFVPSDGIDVAFGIVNPNNNRDQVDIDNAGNGVILPNSEIRFERKITFSDASANGDPLLADDGLAFQNMRINGAGGAAVVFNVPVTADTVSSNRHGGIFNREINIKNILAVSQHQDRWQINASAIAPISYLLIDESRGPDGDTLDGAFRVNSDLEFNRLEHVWGRMRIAESIFVEVATYLYTDHTKQLENNNINPIFINASAILRVADFIIYDKENDVITRQEKGSYGSLDNEDVDFQVDFIIGEGQLIVHDDDVLFADGFDTPQI